jgi:hypothetical protein
VLNDHGELVVAEGELDCIADDAALLVSIVRRLPTAWAAARHQRQVGAPCIVSQEDTHGRSLRIVVCAPLEARPEAHPEASRILPFVGFVSQARFDLPDYVGDAITDADRRLVAQLGMQPDVLAYSSLEVGVGAWCNLVLFRNAWGEEAVTGLAGHREAAYDLAPRYYRWIRLHHGTVTLEAERPKLCLELTKFYTFREQGLPPLVRTEIYTEAAAARTALHAAHGSGPPHGAAMRAASHDAIMRAAPRYERRGRE